ncbi:hypothetical protein PIB30_089782 [Stylosanthes scabra]|uniref:Retrotransposon gag domain-containing protein n=1 Tax=Stylosanthes scabra TaxID=79078 RepID=A0ABU6UWK3_9FABA|nr:hypothetical protein [Stylosanthes scabra]
MLRSHLDLGLLLFDPEIERTLRRARQARRRAELARLASDNNPFDWPGEDPIKHIKDFEVICATTRRTGGDKDAVKAFALPFSLDDRAKDWYHTLPARVTFDWGSFE